jgi:hypothetical protein
LSIRQQLDEEPLADGRAEIAPLASAVVFQVPKLS